MTVTPIYAGLLTLIYVVLSIRVIGARRDAGVALGDGGDKGLFRRQRVHANFAEYVPLGLLLLALLEINGSPPALVHILGAALLLGRLLHAVGVSWVPERIALRVAGMALTFMTLVTAAVAGLIGKPLLLSLMGG